MKFSIAVLENAATWPKTTINFEYCHFVSRKEKIIVKVIYLLINPKICDNNKIWCLASDLVAAFSFKIYRGFRVLDHVVPFLGGTHLTASLIVKTLNWEDDSLVTYTRMNVCP